MHRNADIDRIAADIIDEAIDYRPERDISAFSASLREIDSGDEL